MVKKSDAILKKEAELQRYKEKIQKIQEEIKAQKKRNAAAARKKRTYNLIRFGAIFTKELGIDPTSDEDLVIAYKFIHDYIVPTFVIVKNNKPIPVFYDGEKIFETKYKEFKEKINAGAENYLFYLHRDGMKKILEDFKDGQKNK